MSALPTRTMKHFIRFILALVIALNIAAASLRHTETPAVTPTPAEIHPVEVTFTKVEPEPPARLRAALLAAFDADGDGVLSPAEIANAARVLRTLDANGDGRITADELPRF